MEEWGWKGNEGCERIKERRVGREMKGKAKKERVKSTSKKVRVKGRMEKRERGPSENLPMDERGSGGRLENTGDQVMRVTRVANLVAIGN